MVIILVYYSFIVSDLEVIPINPEKPKPPLKNVVVVYDNTLVPPTIRLCPLLISVVCLFVLLQEPRCQCHGPSFLGYLLAHPQVNMGLPKKTLHTVAVFFLPFDLVGGANRYRFFSG